MVMRSMQLLLGLCSVVWLSDVVSSHICILSPPQRGGYPDDLIPGDHRCYLRTPVCGGIESSDPSLTLVADQTTQVSFMQDLNHWDMKQPGYFLLSVSTQSNPQSQDDFTVISDKLSDYPAYDMVYQTRFQMNIQLDSSFITDHGVLQLRYFSFNPYEIDPSNNTESIFYNCADIRVVSQDGSSGGGDWSSLKKKRSDPNANMRGGLKKIRNVWNDDNKGHMELTNYSCHLPNQIEMWGYKISESQDGSTSLVSDMHIVYDSDAQRTRMDNYNGQYSTITKYNDTTNDDSGYIAEYVIRNHECSKYGADAWYDWGYGQAYGMQSYGNLNSQSDNAYIFEHSSGIIDLVRSLTLSTCVPLSRHFPDGSVIQFTHSQLSVSNSAFDIPVSCQTAELVHSH